MHFNVREEILWHKCLFDRQKQEHTVKSNETKLIIGDLQVRFED